MPFRKHGCDALACALTLLILVIPGCASDDTARLVNDDRPAGSSTRPAHEDVLSSILGGVIYAAAEFFRMGGSSTW
jgi:hypothetical protein